MGIQAVEGGAKHGLRIRHVEVFNIINQMVQIGRIRNLNLNKYVIVDVAVGNRENGSADHYRQVGMCRNLPQHRALTIGT